MNIDLCVVGIICTNNVNMLIYWTSHARACMHACMRDLHRRSVESSPLVCYRTTTKDTNKVALEIDSKGTRKSGAAPSNAPIGINTQLGKAKRYRYPNIIARAGGRLFNAI
jgi:hypothetical protein